MSEIRFKSDIDVSLINSMGGDHMVVAAAKVSTSGSEALKYAPRGSIERRFTAEELIEVMEQDEKRNQWLAELKRLPEKSEKEIAEENAGLINYLVKMRHGTPFEHSALTFFVHAPIFVWREWHRHRIGFSYNEESGRYKQLEPVFYLPDRERPMMKVEGWKPGRPKFTRCENSLLYEQLCVNLRHSYKIAYEMYEANLSLSIDPGLARDCLPVGIYSGCWVTCNPRSLMAFLSLRVHDPDAAYVSYPLWEIDMAARACEKALQAGWPITHTAFVKNGRVAP